MNAPRDDDAQRSFEHRALLNVHALAQRLGYTDQLDRRAEKGFAKWIVAFVALVLLALGAHMLFTPEDPGAIERKRCEIDAAVKLVHEMRKELKAGKPELTEARLEELVKVTDKDIKAEAAALCAAALPKE